MSGYSDIANGSIYSQQMAGFFSRSKSATLDNLARRELVSRSRILYLESPIARACIDVLLRECVGAGLRYSPSENSPYFANYAAITGILGERLSQVSELHVVESTHRLTFPQLQALVFRTILLSGDCFLIRCSDGSVCLKESDYVYTPPFFTQINGIAKTDRGNAIIDGIELDTHSRPIAYWFCCDLNKSIERESWLRVNAFDKYGLPQVLHCAYMERPSQFRGLPLLAPVIEDLWSLRAYLTSETQMAIMQANMSLVITTHTNPTANPFGGLSSMDLDAPLVPEHEDNEPPREFSIAPPPMASSYLDGIVTRTDFIQPGQSIHLAEGEDIKTIAPTAPHSGLETFIRCVVEQIGSAVGIPSQILTARIDSNYASCKAAFAQLQHTVRLYRSMFIEAFLKPWFMNFAHDIIISEGWQSSKYLPDEAALLLATESIWLPSTASTILEPQREIDFYSKALELGLVSRDEVAQLLFGHNASEMPQNASEMPQEVQQ